VVLIEATCHLRVDQIGTAPPAVPRARIALI
jgi:hypothetical protein